MTLHSRAFAPVSGFAVPRLTIGLLTPHNIFNPKAFSGTVYHAARALKRQTALDIRPLCGHRPDGFRQRLARRLGRVPEPALRPGELDGIDAVLGLVASDLLDALPSGLPFFHVTDATPGHLAETYGWDIPESSHIREARIAARAEACIYSSEMMATRAQAELKPGRALVVPFGVNMESLPESLPAKPSLERINLVFVGADWTRKGGDIAINALDLLRADGTDAHLTLVGNIPDRLRGHPGVTVAGFLDKSRPRDAARLSDLYTQAHLMVLPTRGDCTPMVIAEAMAHGTPVLVTDTGGTPEMLGGTGAGQTLPMSAGPEIWAHEIAWMTATPTVNQMLSDAAFDRAQTRFSWAIWADGVVRVITERFETRAHAA